MTGVSLRRLLPQLLTGLTVKPARRRESRFTNGSGPFIVVRVQGTRCWRRKLLTARSSFQSRWRQVIMVPFLVPLHCLPLDPHYDLSQLSEVLVSVSPVLVLRPGPESSWQDLVIFLAPIVAAEYLWLHLGFQRTVLLLINWLSSTLLQQSAPYNGGES